MSIIPVKPCVHSTIDERPGDWNEVLLRICPLGRQPVRWPREKGLDGYREFLLLCDRFSRPETS
jgi:hypothetical protein